MWTPEGREARHAGGVTRVDCDAETTREDACKRHRRALGGPPAELVEVLTTAGRLGLQSRYQDCCGAVLCNTLCIQAAGTAVRSQKHPPSVTVIHGQSFAGNCAGRAAVRPTKGPLLTRASVGQRGCVTQPGLPAPKVPEPVVTPRRQFTIHRLPDFTPPTLNAIHHTP